MPYYLVQATYAPEAVAGMITNPHDREAEGRQAVESLGGSAEGFWFVLGGFDFVAIVQFPDAISATALPLTTMASGALSTLRLTPLLTSAEAMEAMRKAVDATYRHPHHPDAGR